MKFSSSLLLVFSAALFGMSSADRLFRPGDRVACENGFCFQKDNSNSMCQNAYWKTDIPGDKWYGREFSYGNINGGFIVPGGCKIKCQDCYSGEPDCNTGSTGYVLDKKTNSCVRDHRSDPDAICGISEGRNGALTFTYLAKVQCDGGQCANHQGCDIQLKGRYGTSLYDNKCMRNLHGKFEVPRGCAVTCSDGCYEVKQ